MFSEMLIVTKFQPIECSAFAYVWGFASWSIYLHRWKCGRCWV